MPQPFIPGSSIIPPHNEMELGRQLDDMRYDLHHPHPIRSEPYHPPYYVPSEPVILPPPKKDSNTTLEYSGDLALEYLFGRKKSPSFFDLVQMRLKTKGTHASDWNDPSDPK
ncbi:MAG TPA: hypothetical protein VMC80_03250 [Patescibacteria group bacterium]|nr:hypothetical protein [Patescibacteria group bacterium]